MIYVFKEPDYVMWNGTKSWWLRPFNEIEANEDISSEADGDYRSDCILRNMAIRVALDTFIGFVPGSDRKRPSYGSP